jgi:hypothetical protein
MHDAGEVCLRSNFSFAQANKAGWLSFLQSSKRGDQANVSIYSIFGWQDEGRSVH